jgi:hypothetical protein
MLARSAALPLLQCAIAFGLDQEQQFYCGLGSMLHQKRQLLEEQLVEMGFKVLPAEVSRRRCRCWQSSHTISHCRRCHTINAARRI